MGTTGRIYRFDDHTFDPRTGELGTDRGTTRLAPQPALVLSLLLDHAGDLVPRDLLKERVWPDTVVEFDKNLNFCIREVRAALGDRASSPTFIETLPRRGYRFKVPVEVVGPPPSGSHGGRPGAIHESPRRPYPALLATALLVGLGAWLAARPGDARIPGPRAREAAEMGGYLLTRGGVDETARSVGFFREAVSLSPSYARAYSGLGAAYLRLDRVAEGKEALLRSLELDPDQWAPHLTLALRALNVEYDRATAGAHFEAALARGADEVVVRHTYAWYRAVTGDPDAALVHMRAALELDPVSPRVNGDVGRLFYLARRYEQAIAQCRRTYELVPDLRHRDCAMHALVQKGAEEEARREALDVLARHAPESHARVAGNGENPSDALEAYWRWAGATIAERAARGEDSHVHAAAAWARAEEPERAFDELEAAWAVRCPVLLQIGLDPAFAPIRSDPRFIRLLGRIGQRGN